MKFKHLIISIFSSIILLQAIPALSDTGSPADSKFYDRDLLIDTLTADDNQDVDNASAHLDMLNDELSAAEDDLQQLNDSGTATDEEIQQAEDKVASLNADIDQAQDDLDQAQQTAEDELAAITDQVDQLSDDQVRAMNQSLNNTVAQKVVVDIDSEDLQMVIDGNYNFQQINAFTKAYEEEAKFNRLAKKFEDKAADSGDDAFLDKMQSMLDKGDNKKQRFLAKIDEFEGKGNVGMDAKNAAQQMAAESIKSEAKKQSIVDAKSSAKKDMKQTVKTAVMEAAHNDARDVSRNMAIKELKQDAKNKSKNIE